MQLVGVWGFKKLRIKRFCWISYQNKILNNCTECYEWITFQGGGFHKVVGLPRKWSLAFGCIWIQCPFWGVKLTYLATFTHPKWLWARLAVAELKSSGSLLITTSPLDLIYACFMVKWLFPFSLEWVVKLVNTVLCFIITGEKGWVVNGDIRLTKWLGNDEGRSEEKQEMADSNQLVDISNRTNKLIFDVKKKNE